MKINSPPAGRRRRWLRPLAILLLCTTASVATWSWWDARRHLVETDNAYLDGPIHPVASRIFGTVAGVRVEENQRVRAGQILVDLDPADGKIKCDQAAAAISEAEAGVAAAEAEIARATAARDLQQVAREKARLDLERTRGLVTGTTMAVARQELDHALSAYDAATAGTGEAEAVITVAKARLAVAQAKSLGARAAQAEAEQQMSYTRITAPADGWIGRREVESGQPVIPAQPLLAVVGEEVWLTANFKETQIANMRPGMVARVRFDAFPDREWPGRVESLSPASGAKFALLPPDNTTGNFTRVVQRIPVRISLGEEARQSLGTRLVPGLSARVIVVTDSP